MLTKSVFKTSLIATPILIAAASGLSEQAHAADVPLPPPNLSPD